MDEQFQSEIISEEQLKNKEKMITKEKNRLNKLFKKLEKNDKELSVKLIENSAFMVVTLEELRNTIKEKGVKEIYMNGKGQYGFKESVESKTYNTMIKNYMNIMKQLNDMLPIDNKIPDDDFDRF